MANNTSPWPSYGVDAASSAINFGLGLIGNQIAYGQQKKLLKMQQEYATKMWHLNNEYNSPINQKARLDDAGINGALALVNGQLGSGNSYSPASAGGAPSTSSPSMHFDPTSTQQYLLAKQQGAIQMDLAFQDIRGKEIENQYKELEVKAKVIGMLKDLGIKDEVLKGKILENMFDTVTFDNRVDMVESELGLKNMEILGSYYDTLLKGKEFEYFDSKIKAEIALKNSQAFAQYQQGRLSRQQVKTEIMNTWRVYGEGAKANRFSEEQLNRMAEAEIKHLESNQGADNFFQMYQNGTLGDFLKAAGIHIGAGLLATLPIGKLRKLYNRARLKFSKGNVNGNTIEW